MNQGAGLRKVALVLLILLIHASVVSTTHHHKHNFQDRSRVQALGTTADKAPQQGGRSEGDAGCVSCNLQRNFVSDLHTVVFTLDSPPKSVAQHLLDSSPIPDAQFDAVSNRAPPLPSANHPNLQPA